MLYGVDVHDGYQRGLNFGLLARQGYSFAAVKLTQGTDYQRDMGDDWVRAARAAGLIPGGYHWVTRADGAAQARWFYRKVVEAGGPNGMLIQLDCEDDATLSDVRAWAAEWRRLSGNHPFMIYTGAWWWGPRGWPGSTLTPYLWHSHYLSADPDSVPDDPAAFAARIPSSWWTPGYGGWPSATLLQFTSQGDAGSLANNVDLNVTRLTREQLLALTGSGPGPVGPGIPAGEGDDDMTPDQDKALRATAARVNALVDGLSSIVTEWSSVHPDGTEDVWIVDRVKDLVARPTTAPLELSPAQLDAITVSVAARVTDAVGTKIDTLLARLAAAGDALDG